MAKQIIWSPLAKEALKGLLISYEGITCPDGRVFGKMGHSERIGSGLYKKVPGEYNIRMFEAAVKYFR